MASNNGNGRGFVYVFSNPAMPGLLKIGYTLRSPEERAVELRNTGNAADFEPLYYVAFDNPQKAEKFVHKKLAQYRYNQNREFFSCNIHTAIAAIESAPFKRTHQFCSDKVRPPPEHTVAEQRILPAKQQAADRERQRSILEDNKRLREEEERRLWQARSNTLRQEMSQKKKTEKMEEEAGRSGLWGAAISIVVIFLLWIPSIKSTGNFFSAILSSLIGGMMIGGLLIWISGFFGRTALWLKGEYYEEEFNPPIHPKYIWLFILAIVGISFFTNF